jgi:hypothetical protein
MSTITEQQEKTKQVAYAEAMRYMNNAAETLQKARKLDNFYLDKKYVRSACGIAYLGALEALDCFFKLRGVQFPKKDKHKNIDFYTSNVAKLDWKLSGELQAAYRVLHLDGYYGGYGKADIIKSGFDSAYAIIALIKPAQELTPEEYNAIRIQRLPALARPLYSFFFL